MAKIVRCRWRTDGVCPTPAKCQYGYDCEARPVMAAAEAVCALWRAAAPTLLCTEQWARALMALDEAITTIPKGAG